MTCSQSARPSFWFCLILLGWLLAGCAPSAAPAQPATPSLPPATPSPTFLPLPSATFTLPAPSPTPCGETSGRTEDLAVVSTSLKGALKARIHLPPCYDPSGKTRYPVLYLLHGQGFAYDQWERLGAFRAADSLVSGGGARPFFIVLPNEEDTSANPFESAYGQALVESLIPQIDQTYPTCKERACRALGGLSRGASWAVYLGLKVWGKFGILGAHSFPPFFGLDTQLPGLLQAIPPGQAPRIYLDIGFSDPYRAPAAAFEQLLNQASVPHEWYLNAGSHDETYWGAHVAEYMDWYGRQFAQSKH